MKKLGIEIIAVAFTDYHAIILRLEVDTPILRMGRGLRKMNTAMFRDKRVQNSMRIKWTHWHHHKNVTPEQSNGGSDMSKKTQKFHPPIGHRAAQRSQTNGNYLYACIYDILRSSMPQEDKWPALRRCKEKIVKLQADRLQTVLLDTDQKDRIVSEESTLFHVLKMQKRRTARKIQKVHDPLDQMHETPQGIIHTFSRYFKENYAPIEVDARCVEAMAKAIRPNIPSTYGELSEQLITPE